MSQRKHHGHPGESCVAVDEGMAAGERVQHCAGPLLHSGWALRQKAVACRLANGCSRNPWSRADTPGPKAQSATESSLDSLGSLEC